MDCSKIMHYSVMVMYPMCQARDDVRRSCCMQHHNACVLTWALLRAATSLDSSISSATPLTCQAQGDRGRFLITPTPRPIEVAVHAPLLSNMLAHAAKVEHDNCATSLLPGRMVAAASVQGSLIEATE
jgi:hypothetical protein